MEDGRDQRYLTAISVNRGTVTLAIGYADGTRTNFCNLEDHRLSSFLPPLARRRGKSIFSFCLYFTGLIVTGKSLPEPTSTGEIHFNTNLLSPSRGPVQYPCQCARL